MKLYTKRIVVLATGKMEELLENSGLSTWTVSGEQMDVLAKALRPLPGVDQVVAFGNTLHVSTRNPELFERSTEPYRDKEYGWVRTETSLEEVFIDLMQNKARAH